MASIKSRIEWLGHDSFRITGKGLVVYIDPWQIGGGAPADLILVTHDHSDHCSPEDIAKIQKGDTDIVTVKAAAQKLSGRLTVVKPGDEITVKGVSITVVPSYNTNKGFHPKDAGYAGFIIDLDGERIYHAGDTDVIAEMSSMSVDIALLPVSGIYVMTADEAAEAANLIKPKVAIPMHVGRGIGSLDDLKRFKEKSSVPVEILPMNE
jgi:L-ascorbate metabolism protein UlaG (beta-lactamase superfamily)